MTSPHHTSDQNLSNTKKIHHPLQLLAFCISSLMFNATAFAAEQDHTSPTPVQLALIKVHAVKDQQSALRTTRINSDQLERHGANDMAGIIKYLPLVTAPKAMVGSGNAWDSSGTSGYNIRGVDGNRIGLDVDGVDLAPAAPRPDSYQTNTGGVGRDFIDPEMLSQVDILSGTTAAKHDGIGGRVSFKTKSPEDYLSADKDIYAAYKAGYSSADDAWLNSVTAAAGNDTFKALVAYAHRQGKETKSEGRLKENPVDWNADAILSRLLWNITPQQQLGFTFDHYKRQTDRFIDAASLPRAYPRGGRQDEVAERNRYALDYRLNQATTMFDQLKTQVYYQKTSSDNQLYAYYNTGKYFRQINNDFESKVWGFKADANKSMANHDIQYGVGASRTKDNRPWIQHNVDQGTSVTQNRMVNTDTDKYFAYLTDQMTFNVLNRSLKVTPGLRYEYQQLKPKNSTTVWTAVDKQQQVQSSSRDYFAPSLGVSYQLAPNYLSYFNYSHGVRVPTAAEMMGSFSPSQGYSVLGNSRLKEESSDAFELGFKTAPIKGLTVDLNGFYTRYQDFLDYSVLDYKASGDSMFTLQIQNIADVDIWGAEITAKLDLGEFFAQSQGYSLSLAAGKAKASGKKNDGSKAAVNSVQPEKASMAFHYDAPDQRYGLRLSATAVADRLANEDRIAIPGGRPNVAYKRVAGYTVTDLSAYWNVNQYSTLNIGLNNLFDKKYLDYAKVGLLNNENLIDRATETGRNVFASVEFKY